MASVVTPFDNYKTGASMSYPIVIKSPYADWRSLLIRCKVKTSAELHIGSLVEQADSGTPFIVEKTADESEVVLGIIPDTIENITQLEKDNGAKATKALYYTAGSYIWVLPLFPGFVLSMLLKDSSGAIDAGSHVCAYSTDGQVRLEDDAAKDDVIGMSLAQATVGTGVNWIPILTL